MSDTHKESIYNLNKFSRGVSVISDEKLSVLRSLFAECDKDGSGSIEPAELQELLVKMGHKADEKRVMELFSTMDVDGGGTINFYEFTTRAPSELLEFSIQEKRSEHEKMRNARKLYDQDKMKAVRKLFAKYDKDGSGSIDPQEFYDMLKSLGHNISDEEVTKVMQEMDTDGDGTINFMEFLNGAPEWLINSVLNSPSFSSPKPFVSHKKTYKKRKLQPDNFKDIINVFRKNDNNEDGNVSVETIEKELAETAIAIYAPTNEPYDPYRVQQYFHVDLRGIKLIGFKEFIACVEHLFDLSSSQKAELKIILRERNEAIEKKKKEKEQERVSQEVRPKLNRMVSDSAMKRDPLAALLSMGGLKPTTNQPKKEDKEIKITTVNLDNRRTSVDETSTKKTNDLSPLKRSVSFQDISNINNKEMKLNIDIDYRNIEAVKERFIQYQREISDLENRLRIAEELLRSQSREAEELLKKERRNSKLIIQKKREEMKEKIEQVEEENLKLLQRTGSSLILDQMLDTTNWKLECEKLDRRVKALDTRIKETDDKLIKVREKKSMYKGQVNNLQDKMSEFSGKIELLEDLLKVKEVKIMNMIDRKVELEDEKDRLTILVEKLSKSEYALLQKLDRWKKKFIELGVNPEEDNDENSSKEYAKAVEDEQQQQTDC